VTESSEDRPENTRRPPGGIGTEQLRVTPEEAAKQISFALSELGADNAHHDFEHLCRHLTRRKVCPNIVPATGPVSAGGDQGADFETYKVAAGAQALSAFFSKSVQDKWLFACSLEKNYKKKIKSDLKAAKEFPEPVQQLVFFHNAPIPTSSRHKLKKDAIEEFGIELEIFDSKAIAEMLADRETVWIAQRYLSLPSELVLPQEDSAPDWFQEVIQKTYIEGELTSAQFFELRDAIRYATHRAELHSNLAELLGQVRLFRSHPIEKISRKAVYEEFVASLRGLETTAGLESVIRQYLERANFLSDPAELEDSAVLATYALAAQHQGILDLPADELRQQEGRILARVSQLAAEATSPARKCPLLFVLGFLALNNYMTLDFESEQEIEAALQKSIDSAAKIWLRLMREAKDAPTFPIDRLARLLNDFLVLIAKSSAVDQLVKRVDALSEKRSGKMKVSENHRQRAQAFANNRQFLKALNELHEAHKASFAGGMTFEAVKICLQLAGIYEEMGLHFAAKYYGLAACYASLRLPDEDLRKLAYLGCAIAASADHATGGSLNFFLTAHMFAYVAIEYPMGGSEERKGFESARIDFYCILLTRASGLVAGDLQAFIIDRILPAMGMSEAYEESKPMLDAYFRDIQTATDLAKKATRQGIAPPFSDVGGMRRTAWRQLGIEWHLQWRTVYETDRQAQALAADLQILLAELATEDLSIIPGKVSVTIEVHDKELEIEEVPDNTCVTRVIRLPQPGPEPREGIAGYAFAVASTLVKTVSALPHKPFLELMEKHYKGGMSSRVTIYVANESLFEEFYDELIYGQIYSTAGSSGAGACDFVVDTWEGLEGPKGLHPLYSAKDSLRAVRQRYETLITLTKDTVRRLMESEQFRELIAELRKLGWKDWHILTGLEGVRFNYILNRAPRLISAVESHDNAFLKEIRAKGTNEDVFKVPVSAFTLEEMKRNVHLSQLDTLRVLGLEMWQPTPNFSGMDSLLTRFRYWEDDLPHEDPFKPE
jgi:hypothetical protein